MSSDSAPPPLPEQYATRDQLRALAHPLRMRIMEQVGRRGTARAADLAEDLGVPANSVSYHLRILARGGVVAEAPEAARDRRDRVWRLAQTSFRTEASGQPEYDAARDAMALAAFDLMRSTWVAERARQRASGAEGEHHSESSGATLYGTSMRLSPAQMKELTDLVGEKILEYAQLNRTEGGQDLPGDPDSEGDARTYQVLFAVTATHGPHEPPLSAGAS